MISKTEGRYLTFAVADGEYGVEIQKVREILEPSLMEPLSNPTSHARWVLRVRGRVVPVVDLRRRLGLEKTGARPTQSVLTVMVRGWNGPQLMGLLVDGIREVVQLWSRDLEGMEDKMEGAGGGCFYGPICYQDRELLLLDVDGLSQEMAFREFHANDECKP